MGVNPTETLSHEKLKTIQDSESNDVKNLLCMCETQSQGVPIKKIWLHAFFQKGDFGGEEPQIINIYVFLLPQSRF